MTEQYCNSRRGFLRSCFAGALAAVTPPAPAKSRVVIGRDPALRPSGAGMDSSRLLAMLDRSMQALCDRDSPVEAWKRIVRPGEVIGLKVNCLAGKGISTSVALVEAICERLQQTGIPAKDIIIWDRLSADLESAGFRVSTQPRSVRFIGNDVLGYEEELAAHGAVGSLLCKTLTRTCDAVINLPVLKDHGIVGVTMAMKNMFGAIHNPNKYHLDVGNPYVADVCMLQPVRQKVRLTICDATMAQYEGGPSFMPQWSWPFNGLLVSRDPVALDYTGWQLIEKKRAEKGMKSLKDVGRAPTYIATAADAQHRLGTNDPAQIERVEI
jgi:uncharacterized protein (DUF362 family)